MSKARKLSLSVIFQFINIFVKGLVGILIVPIIINLIGQEYYGVLEVILSLMFINFFFELGLGSTLLRFIPVYEKEGKETLNKFLWTYLYFKSGLAVVAALIIVVIGIKFDYFFNIGNSDITLVQQAVYIFAGGVFITNFATFFSNTLKGFQRFDYAIIPELISYLFFLILIYVLKYREISNVDIVNVAFLMFILRPIVRIILSIIFIKMSFPYVDLFSPWKPQKIFLKESMSFLGGMSFISILSQFTNKGPKLIIGAFLNPLSVAYWGIAQRLKNPIQQINSSLVRPLIPMGSSMNLDHQINIHQLIIRITKVHFVIIGGLVFFIMFYVGPFVKLWLGDGYLVVGDIVRIWFFPLILPNASIMMMFYYAKGKTKLSQHMGLIKSTFGLVLGSILLFEFGVVGMAYGLTISVVVTTFFHFYYLCKEFDLKFSNILVDAYFRPYIVLGILSTLNYFLICIVDLNNWIYFISTVLTSFIVYVYLNVLFLSKEDKKYFSKLIKNLIRTT
ncbi:MAG: oligosaccharide flippase family protein [Candidatus Woesearchaeota archaeon]